MDIVAIISVITSGLVAVLGGLTPPLVDWSKWRRERRAARETGSTKPQDTY